MAQIQNTTHNTDSRPLTPEILTAAGYDKACKLATAATKESKASYTVVLHACIEMFKWQAEQDKLELDAKDESIIQMEMSQFEIIQQVCKYREFLAGSFKCGEKRNFCCECNKKNCPMIK